VGLLIVVWLRMKRSAPIRIAGRNPVRQSRAHIMHEQIREQGYLLVQQGSSDFF
jgi:hypothetical protein